MKQTVTLLLIAALLFGAAFGCEPAKEEATETSPKPIAELTAEPTAEPFDPLLEIAEAEIGEGRHEREEGYPNPFKTYLLDTKLAAVHLESGEQYSDGTLRALAKTVASDLLLIGERTGETPGKVTLYIVWNLLQDRPILLGDHLICSAEQVQNGAYREALIGISLDLPIVWKQVGLTEIVFGAPDDSGLAEYYQNETHAPTVSCAAVYFVEGFADDETVTAARKTAASITAYLLETGGFDALRKTADAAEILPAWAERHGIEMMFVFPNGHEQAAAMTAYRNRRSDVLCVMQSGRYTIDIRDGSFVRTPDEAYDFVCRFLYGADVVLAQICEESPTLWETAERRAKETISIHLIHDATQRGISYGGVNEIELVGMPPTWHELVHALLITPITEDNLWINEAIAEHFSHRALSLARSLGEIADFDVRYYPLPAGITENELAFYKACWNIYLSERGEDDSVPSALFSFGADRRAIGIAELILSDDPIGWGQDSSVGATAGRQTGKPEEDGNALSYYEAAVFLEYLFDTFGSDTVTAAFANGMSTEAIEHVCGKPYAELYRDCVAYYTEKYGDLVDPSK